MKKTIFFLAAVFFFVAVAIPVVSPAAGSAVAAAVAVDDDPETPPPPPPQSVSPADPSIEMPDAGGWCCWCCGAANPGHGWSRKGQMPRPALGAGQRGHGSRANRGERPGDGHPGYNFPHRGMARGGEHGGGFCGGVAAERMLRHAADLSLSDEQTAKLETLTFETKKKLVDLHSEVEKGQLEIQNILRSGSDDLNLVKRHLSAVSKARADIQEARIVNLFESRKLLTDEQKKLVKEKHPRLGRVLD